MNRFRLCLMSLVILIGLIGCNDKPVDNENEQTKVEAQSSPIKVSAGEYYNEYSKSYIPQVIITSLSDSVTIKDVLVNKGNCKYSKEVLHYIRNQAIPESRDLFPKKLLYGKELKISVSRCNILRVDVETNQGDWSVEY